jgi:hypothetical protein
MCEYIFNGFFDTIFDVPLLQFFFCGDEEKPERKGDHVNTITSLNFCLCTPPPNIKPPGLYIWAPNQDPQGGFIFFFGGGFISLMDRKGKMA